MMYVGCLIKQCNLGLYYLQQKDIALASKIIGASFTLLRIGLNKTSEWSTEDSLGYEQLVLYLSAYRLYVENVSTVEDIEASLLRALVSPTIMLPIITNRILNLLVQLYKTHGYHDKVESIEDLVGKLKLKEYKFHVDTKFASCKVPSTVMFLINYSESMVGFKIKSSKYYCNYIQERILHNHDSLGISTFNSDIDYIRLIERMDTTAASTATTTTASTTTASSFVSSGISTQLSSLLHPSKECHLYDALSTSISDIQQYNARQIIQSYEDTIILFTDTIVRDSSTSTAFQDVCDNIRKSRIKLIIVWVCGEIEEDMPTESLFSSLIAASRKGQLIDGSKKQPAEVDLKAIFNPSSSTMSEGVLVVEEY
jgi:hypothetical protein